MLVTGATGSGKTTTLAAMLGHINRTRQQHIVTIEDPIEILHADDGCIVNQREVGLDTGSFHEALRRALRQDPDVILIGELRDAETAETALQAAESGHLVLSTMHTVDAAETVGRLVEFFPALKQPQVRSILSGVLKGVVSQRLLPRANGGRVAAVEVMITNSRIADLIRENKPEYISEAIADGTFFDMQTLSNALIDLVSQEKSTARRRRTPPEPPRLPDRARARAQAAGRRDRRGACGRGAADPDRPRPRAARRARLAADRMTRRGGARIGADGLSATASRSTEMLVVLVILLVVLAGMMTLFLSGVELADRPDDRVRAQQEAGWRSTRSGARSTAPTRCRPDRPCRPRRSRSTSAPYSADYRAGAPNVTWFTYNVSRLGGTRCGARLPPSVANAASRPAAGREADYLTTGAVFTAVQRLRTTRSNGGLASGSFSVPRLPVDVLPRRSTRSSAPTLATKVPDFRTSCSERDAQDGGLNRV